MHPRLEPIHKKIRQIRKDYNIDESIPYPQILAVSKYQPVEKIMEFLDCGHRAFAENRVQDALEKWTPLQQIHPDIELHLVGHLQSNKAKQAVSLFQTIQSLDRASLARTLADLQQSGYALPRLYIQVNTGEEPQKGGILPKDLPAFLHKCRTEYAIDIQGLMCIPPVNEPATLHFAFLKKLSLDHDIKELSMGMSGDYHNAVPYHPAYMRLGTILFGEREATRL